MPEAKLKALYVTGLKLEEIAEANFRSEGWRPSKFAVQKRLKAMGAPPRRRSHKNLLPWRIRPEHSSSVLRHALEAESRYRQGAELSESDKRLRSGLQEKLYGRGKLMVVGYHEEVGFYLTERKDYDLDIIRDPRADVYTADAYPEG